MSLKLVRTYIIDSLDMDRSKSRCMHDGLNRDMQRLLPSDNNCGTEGVIHHSKTILWISEEKRGLPDWMTVEPTML
jgi:hypothetical protein